MGKWAARLAEDDLQKAAPAMTDKTDKSPPEGEPRPLLAVLSVPQGAAFGNAQAANEPGRRYRLTVEEADRCHAGGWTDAEIATFTARHVRLLALRFSGGDADDLAERLTLRDRDGDERRLCVECAHYRRGRCMQAAQSGVGPEVGALAVVLQHCPAFGPVGFCRGADG